MSRLAKQDAYGNKVGGPKPAKYKDGGAVKPQPAKTPMKGNKGGKC